MRSLSKLLIIDISEEIGLGGKAGRAGGGSLGSGAVRVRTGTGGERVNGRIPHKRPCPTVNGAACTVNAVACEAGVLATKITANRLFWGVFVLYGGILGFAFSG